MGYLEQFRRLNILIQSYRQKDIQFLNFQSLQYSSSSAQVTIIKLCLYLTFSFIKVNLTFMRLRLNLVELMMCDGQEGEEKDGIEHYLRALRKKVEHQVRNPFDLAFANYTFEELASWKNNVLQLDATSRLYGQRVDFLHSGTLQILGSVLNNEQAQQSNEQRQEVRRQQLIDNPCEQHLEQPQKISSEVERCQGSCALWREVCKKRDALHQMMLNELPIDNSLSLVLTAGGSCGEVYESIINEEPSVYLKLLDFKAVPIKFLTIFSEIEEEAQSVNNFMLTFSGKARGEGVRMESVMEFDFDCFGQEYFPQQMEVPNFEDGLQCSDLNIEPLEQQDREIPPSEQEQSEFEESQDYFEFDDWNRNDRNTKKAVRSKRQRRRGADRQKKEEMVDFTGMPLEKLPILLMETEEEQEKFLNPRDYLLLKFVKYGLTAVKKPKKVATAASKFKPQDHHQLEPQTALEPTTCQIPFSEPLSWNQANLSKQSQVRFKEAGIPIKQMKKRIRERVSIGQDKQLRFYEIKQTFANEEPLDIFISVLHIAAEEQAFVMV